jgi:hypothetical protein
MVESQGDETSQAQPKVGALVETACHWQVRYSPELPSLRLEEGLVYFCLPACVDAYRKNPCCSCLSKTADCSGSRSA